MVWDSSGRFGTFVWDSLGHLSQTVPNYPKPSQTVPNHPKINNLGQFWTVWDGFGYLSQNVPLSRPSARKFALGQDVFGRDTPPYISLSLICISLICISFSLICIEEIVQLFIKSLVRIHSKMILKFHFILLKNISKEYGVVVWVASHFYVRRVVKYEQIFWMYCRLNTNTYLVMVIDDNLYTRGYLKSEVIY